MHEEYVNTPATDESLPFSIENAGISYCDGSYRIHRRKSKVTVIEYVISGSGTILTRGETYTPSKGDTYLLLPGEEHTYFSSSDDPWTKIWINVTGSLPNALIDAYGIRNQTVFKCDTGHCIEKFHSILKDSSLSLDEVFAKCSMCFHEIVQILYENTDKNFSASEDAQIIKNYIDTNISENITIDRLASLIFKSPSQTIRIFKKSYGVTPYNYHMKNRISKAISLLCGTNLPVKAIAYMLGFDDEHYFSSLFRSKTGKKPTEYRTSNNSEF